MLSTKGDIHEHLELFGLQKFNLKQVNRQKKVCAYTQLKVKRTDGFEITHTDNPAQQRERERFYFFCLLWKGSQIH